ncbi:MAG: PIN domain-containing protein [Gemmatimonadales bacterium]
MATFTVVYDACVLYPAPLRDLLLRIGAAGIARARWTDEILDEMVAAILRNRSDLDPGALNRTRELMCRALPDCLVREYHGLADTAELPDPRDRHIVAAAIRCGAQAIITTNLKDFPDHVLARWDLEAKHPDEFVNESIDIAPGVVVGCLTEPAAALKSPPQTVEQLLARFRAIGLVRSAGHLRDLVTPISLS